MVMEIEKIKLQTNGYRYPVDTWVENSFRYFRFDFNRNLKNEIKSMEGARWEPERRLWYVANTRRNQFQLDYLKGLNPYERYDHPLVLENIPTVRFNKVAKKELALYQHQREGVAHKLQRKQCIIAGEMGTGKSLMMGISGEILDTDDWWYIGPKSAIMAVQRDFNIWGIKPLPSKFLTYEAFTKLMKNWSVGMKAPKNVDFDEASKLKNPTSQRTQAARALVEGMRQDWDNECYIGLWSGTPAPKSPADWWALAEIACPGFLKEGDIYKFKNRLGIIIQKEGIDGGSYPQLVTWRNNPDLCDLCGQPANHGNHFLELLGTDSNIHVFKPSVNEVQKLYNRLKGLTVVYLKKDCLDLPEKIYRVIEVKPKASTIRAAKIIQASARSTIQGLTLLRELSDGFQYAEESSGFQTCSLCKGEKEIDAPVEIENSCPNCPDSDKTLCGNHQPLIKQERVTCPTCQGSGETETFERQVKEVPCPKDDAFVDLLEEFEDVGRVVVYGGFTGTIDRAVNLARRQGWYVIRMDGGKIQISDPKGVSLEVTDFQTMFQQDFDNYDKVAFIAHPKSGGMGLTLTASPVIIYFSNTFDAEDRIQSEDRIHRPGMDLNRGATIIDLVHLPSDLKVLENLKKKRDLQAMTLGDFDNDIDEERNT